MKCLPYSNLIYDDCVEFSRSNRVSCSTTYTINLEDVQWNRIHRTEMEQRKRGWQSTQDTVLDKSEFVITYTLCADSKSDLRIAEKDMSVSLQPNDTQSDRNVITGAYDQRYGMQYRKLSFTDPEWQEWIAWAKFQSIELVRRSQDGCKSSWRVTFILWSRNCRDVGCFYGDKHAEWWFGNETQSFTTSPSPIPPTMPGTPHPDKIRWYWQWFVNPPIWTYPDFFDYKLLLRYNCPSCCVATYGIRAITSLTWPIVLYVLWSDYSFQAIQLDVPTVSAWATIVFRDDWSVHIIDPLSPIPDTDVTNMLSDKYCKIPMICPHKEILYSDWIITDTWNNIIAFWSNSGDSELYINCRNTRC